MWSAAVINLAAEAFTFFSLMPSIFNLFIGKKQVLAPQWVTQKVAYCYKQITDYEPSNQIQGPHNFTLGNSFSNKQNQKVWFSILFW